MDTRPPPLLVFAGPVRGDTNITLFAPHDVFAVPVSGYHARDFFLIWFSVVGFWVLQPRLNKLMEE